MGIPHYPPVSSNVAGKSTIWMIFPARNLRISPGFPICELVSIQVCGYFKNHHSKSTIIIYNSYDQPWVHHPASVPKKYLTGCFGGMPDIHLRLFEGSPCPGSERVCVLNFLVASRCTLTFGVAAMRAASKRCFAITQVLYVQRALQGESNVMQAYDHSERVRGEPSGKSIEEEH